MSMTENKCKIGGAQEYGTLSTEDRELLLYVAHAVTGGYSLTKSRGSQIKKSQKTSA